MPSAAIPCGRKVRSREGAGSQEQRQLELQPGCDERRVSLGILMEQFVRQRICHQRTRCQNESGDRKDPSLCLNLVSQRDRPLRLSEHMLAGSVQFPFLGQSMGTSLDGVSSSLLAPKCLGISACRLSHAQSDSHWTLSVDFWSSVFC